MIRNSSSSMISTMAGRFQHSVGNLAACTTRELLETPLAHTKHSTSNDPMDCIPTEILVEVFKQLDMESAYQFAATCKRYSAVFIENRASIILTIAKRDFSPFDQLLQVVTMSREDLTPVAGQFDNKRVWYGGTMLCDSTMGNNDGAGSYAGDPIRHLQHNDITRLVAVCKVVYGWERVFPQHRFGECPLKARCLSPQENARLRGALYHWMRFAYYFHQDHPRISAEMVSRHELELHYVARLSNRELSALDDLRVTVFDAIRAMLCPPIENVLLDAVSGDLKRNLFLE
jgi:hypothetical protein